MNRIYNMRMQHAPVVLLAVSYRTDAAVVPVRDGEKADLHACIPKTTQFFVRGPIPLHAACDVQAAVAYAYMYTYFPSCRNIASTWCHLYLSGTGWRSGEGYRKNTGELEEERGMAWRSIDGQEPPNAP